MGRFRFELGVLILGVIPALFGLNYWPISNFPMFSQEWNLEEVKTFQLRLATENGSVIPIFSQRFSSELLFRSQVRADPILMEYLLNAVSETRLKRFNSGKVQLFEVDRQKGIARFLKIYELPLPLEVRN